jgi:6-phosphogluconolactonase/glucosamine-6-phosphate isomerase/deaminase
MVSGASKAQAVFNVIEGKKALERYPAQNIQSLVGNTIWYLDQDAARQLT